MSDTSFTRPSPPTETETGSSGAEPRAALPERRTIPLPRPPASIDEGSKPGDPAEIEDEPAPVRARRTKRRSTPRRTEGEKAPRGARRTRAPRAAGTGSVAITGASGFLGQNVLGMPRSY